MGHGSYKASDWAKLKDSRGINSTSSASQIFSKSANDKYNPRYIQTRESCDSADSPESTPIIIGFDVTGSMGYLAEEIAKNALNKTVLNIYDKNPVSHPHVLCAAIGDVCDRAPLQVTQFEADIRIAEQLMDLWLEMKGGDIPESYNLLWYFADRHTRTDSFAKRGKPGFLFTIGDATVHPGLSASDIRYVFKDEVPGGLSNRELLDAVSQKYQVFHITTQCGGVMAHWQSLLPGRVAFLSSQDIHCLSEVIISIMQLTNGMPREDVLAQWPPEIRPTVAQAILEIFPKKKLASLFSGLFHK